MTLFSEATQPRCRLVTSLTIGVYWTSKCNALLPRVMGRVCSHYSARVS